MQKPLALPSSVFAKRGRPAFFGYFDRRLESSEDRYMALYGREEWDSSNMDLSLHVAPDKKDQLVNHFMERLERRIDEASEDTRLLREEADFRRNRLSFRTRTHIRIEELLQPRQGVYIDLEQSDRIRVVWNHMQTDGVGMWNALRTLFDPNPPLIPYRDVPAPPPMVPEMLALPSLAQRLTWRGRLRPHLPNDENLTRGIVCWDAAQVRQIRDQVAAPFNLVSTGLAVHEVFRRHADRDVLTVGVTAYFPFLKGRNKYGVLMCKVQRGDIKSVVTQLTRQTSNQLMNWGRSAAQSMLLRQLPDEAFSKVVGYYRRQIDVLVSNLPVGQEPIRLGGISTVLSCHPWELTLPYYFLLIGTRHQLHASFTSRFRQDAQFLNVAPVVRTAEG